MADQYALNSLEIIRARNNFYIKGYRSLSIAIFYSLLICLLLVILLIYFYFTQAKPVYFATGEQCQLVPMLPLSEPYVSDKKIVSWSRDAVVDIFDYNYKNYQLKFNDVQKYFTLDGFSDYKNNVQQSGNLNTLTAKGMSTVAKLFGNPILQEKGTVFVDGVATYLWVVQANALLTYESSLASITQCAKIVMRIFRTTPLINPLGFGIGSIISDTATPKKKLDGTCEFS